MMLQKQTTVGRALLLALAILGAFAALGASTPLIASIFRGSGSTTDAIDLATSEVGGILPVANGGTGASSLSFSDAQVSDTLTSSIFHGSGSTTDAVDLGTSEVSGTLADANVSNTLTSSIFVGSGSSTNAIDLATAEVAGVLPVANGGTGASSLAFADADVSDTLTASIFKGSGTTTNAVDLATAEVAGTLPIANVATSTVCMQAGGSACTMTAATVTSTLNFASQSIGDISIAADTTFTASGMAAGLSLSFRIVNSAAVHTLTFPSWTFIGAAAPASIAASKTALVSVICFSTTAASCVASYAVQP